MTKQEYLNEVKELDIEHAKKLKALQIKCANENNDVKVGDKFTDHCGTILVEKISVFISYCETPSCVYYGLELKRDGTPTKKGTRRDAYQMNKRK